MKDSKTHIERLIKAIELMGDAERHYVNMANRHGMGSREELEALTEMEATRFTAGGAAAEAEGFLRSTYTISE